MTTLTLSRFAPILASLILVGAAGVAGQIPGKSTDIDQYREYLIKVDDAEPKDGAVKVTFLGTATLLFDDGETQLMIDGFFTRPSMFKIAAGKIETDKKIVDAALKRAKADRVKAVFVAHSHYDHALDAAYVSQKSQAKLYGSSSTLNVGRGGDLREDQMVLFEPGKEYAIGRFAVTVLKGKHSPPIKGINDDLGQTIDKPLKQPASAREYKEGGAFDFLIKHGDKTMLVEVGGNYIEGALDKIRADVLFLSTGMLGSETKDFQNAYYDETVGKVKPRLVIPVHWDCFFLPLSDHLQGLGDLGFDFLIDRLKADKIRFGILQGYQSATLFGKGAAVKKE